MTEKPDNNAQTTACDDRRLPDFVRVCRDPTRVRAIVETEVFDNARREQAQIPAGFPWLLVIQILLTILSYMASRANTKPERDRFLHLHTELSYWKDKQ